MPFVKTEVDIKTDYQLQSVDSGWLKEGVKSPKHLMLDPEPCILCRACEDVCPWNAIWMLDPNIVSGAQDPSVTAEVGGAYAIFVVDDHACTRCSVCVERCPSGFPRRAPASAPWRPCPPRRPRKRSSVRSEERRCRS
jgi:formate hydrogenlyase subunit 6/NADH:ubiquinone oxidoreductase subunit I